MWLWPLSWQLMAPTVVWTACLLQVMVAVVVRADVPVWGLATTLNLVSRLGLHVVLRHLGLFLLRLRVASAGVVVTDGPASEL